MRGIVKNVTQNRSGKSKSAWIEINGKDTNYCVGNDTEIGSIKGRTIECESGVIPGTQIATIESYMIVEDSQAPIQQLQPAQQDVSGPFTGPSTGDFIPDRFLPMTSNVLASAIARGAPSSKYAEIVKDLMAAVNK